MYILDLIIVLILLLILWLGLSKGFQLATGKYLQIINTRKKLLKILSEVSTYSGYTIECDLITHDKTYTIKSNNKIYLNFWDDKKDSIKSMDNLVYELIHESTHIIMGEHSNAFDKIEEELLRIAELLGYFDPQQVTNICSLS